MILGRRDLLLALALAPFAAVACRREPQTPLAHLYGNSWVEGVYELHAKRYLDVQMGAETSSHGAYRVLAQKGVASLLGLQKREVPFYMRVNPQTGVMRIDRDIPERLTFTANMTAAEREEATRLYHKAREHLHTDYYEIHRLDWTMTTLLAQLLSIHSAMEAAELEQFRLVRDLVGMRDGAPTPYQLPQGVTRDDYTDVLVLLLLRLESDRYRLATIEASIAAVGLTARATDAGSGSLSANLNKVLLAVIRDAEATTPKPARYPKDDKVQALSDGRALAWEIEKSAAYIEWKRAEDAKALETVGVLFEAIDAVTHLPTSAMFQAVIGIWRGDGDYLTYLKAVATLVPGGGRVAQTVRAGIDTSERVREVVRRARSARDRLERGSLGDAVVEQVSGQAGAMLNTSTAFGRKRVARQLAFFTDQAELDEVQDEVEESPLMTQPMPEVPNAPGRP